MTVVDSSAWLECFAGGPRADAFAAAIEDTGSLLVRRSRCSRCSSACCSSVTKALRCVGLTQQRRVVDLDASLQLADSVIFATARRANAELWTQDADFEGLPGVHYFPKR